MPNLDLYDEIIPNPNVAELLSKDTLEDIGRKVVKGYEIDETSRDEWKERYTEAIKMAKQVVKKKNRPWRNASNVKYPLLTIAGLQFHARAYPALTPSSGIVQAKVIGRDPQGLKLRASERISMHMSYQVEEEMPDWEEDFDKLLITLPFTGCEFKKTYFNTEEGIPDSIHVHAGDLVVNYGAASLERAYRKTHIIPKTKREIIEKQRLGLYLDCDLDLPHQSRDDEITDVRNESQGVLPPSEQDDAQEYVILEQHTFHDLDGDGYEEPYIITVDKETKKVLRIVARFDEESIQETDMGIIIKPHEYFTKYEFIPSPDGGFYGMGFGTLLGPLNAAVDTAINQLIDAGTLSNLQSGFISKSLRVRNGNLEFEPGEWKTVNATGQDLNNSIVPLPVREPSMVLFQLLGTLINAGERIASVSDMMVGENPGQNQKATTTLAVLDQGMKVFTAIYKRVRRSLQKEFEKIYLLNQIYIDSDVYYDIVSPDEEEIQILDLEKTDYETAGIKIVPSADPNIATQMQRELQARAALELTTVNRFEAERRYLQAIGVVNLDTLLQDPADTPPSLDMIKEMNEERERAFRREFEMAQAMAEAEQNENENAINMFNALTKRIEAEGKIVNEAAKTSAKVRTDARKGAK